ncbi:MAG: thiamine pyrophosphate-binding protein [Actinobacteria bacterium]|nr:thiamine pyrophosphate-binding protein [Actinomycetota bacterium]MBU2687154.1 thiamine pyrophosphate-binding protein [Actinomycetota bacterium]
MGTATGCEVIAASIAAAGIRYVFTTSTPRLEPLLEALRAHPFIELVEARNESAATVMGDGYVRRSRRLAAVLTDDNGAALSQVSGVTNAWADKIPLLSLSLCARGEPDHGKGFDRYRFDQGAVFQPVTLWRSRLDSIADAPRALEEAVKQAVSYKMGPTHLDIPFDLLAAEVEDEALPSRGPFEEKRVEAVRLAGDREAVERATALIADARRPLLFLGGGVHASGAHEEARLFAERFGIPVATSMAGIGTLPADHELSLGSPSYTAGEAFHVAIKEADVVIAVGVSFSGLEGFGLLPLWSGRIRFVHVDISPFQIGLNVQPHAPILGDARTVMAQLAASLEERGFSGGSGWDAWRARLRGLKRGRAKRLARNAAGDWPRIHQGRFAQEIGRFTGRDDLLMVIDGGNTPLYGAMYAPPVAPGQVFFPFGMSALGGGIPYAVGVQLASPDRRVLLATGDGSFMYNVQELETIKRLDLPIIIAVNNDSAWNMIKAMQDSLFERNYVGTCLPDLDYARIAEGFGLAAERVTRAEEIAPAYERALASGGPALIDVVTDSTNIPDSLLSFFLVEFEGALGGLDPLRLARSLWLMRDIGPRRMLYLAAYVRKALLRINPMSRAGGGR